MRISLNSSHLTIRLAFIWSNGGGLPKNFPNKEFWDLSQARVMVSPSILTKFGEVSFNLANICRLWKGEVFDL